MTELVYMCGVDINGSKKCIPIAGVEGEDAAKEAYWEIAHGLYPELKDYTFQDVEVFKTVDFEGYI